MSTVGLGYAGCRKCRVYTPKTILAKHDGMCHPCANGRGLAELAEACLAWEQESARAYPKLPKNTPEHRED